MLGVFRRRPAKLTAVPPPAAPAFGHFTALHGLARRGYSPLVILDVGAAVGDWTRIALAVWPTARCIMVEPLEERAATLTAFAASSGGLIDYIAAGLADVDADMELGVTAALFDSSFTYKGVRSRMVPVRRLDDLVIEGRVPLPNLIKLDVQGFELRVLSGGKTALANADFVVMECTFFRFVETNPDLTDSINWMAAHGFRPYEIVDFLRRPLDNAMAQCDLLFVRATHPLALDCRWS